MGRKSRQKRRAGSPRDSVGQPAAGVAAASTPGSQSQSNAKLPAWKKALFATVVTVVFFALLEGVLALVGVETVLHREDPFVGFVSTVPLFVPTTDADGQTVLTTAHNKRSAFNVQTFAAQKVSGTFRIFCMGGSTTFGRPYDDATSFCGWLRAFLPVADPARRWEVVNAGGISYASYRATVLMEQLAAYEPDLFIVYTGHNEFLEERTYRDVRTEEGVLSKVRTLAYRTRTYAALESMLRPRAKAGAKARGKGPATLLSAEVNTKLDAAVGPRDYHRDDARRRMVIEHFRISLDRMVNIGRGAGASLLFVTPASNLRSCTPFKSEHSPGLSTSALARWQAAFERGQQRSAAGDFAGAVAAYDQAVALDDRHAALHFRRGEALYALHQHADAGAAFVRAREEDVCPLRALTPIEEAVREIAEARDVPLVDFPARLDAEMAARYAHRILGEEFFLDHVHPTIEGHRILALAILDALVEGGDVTLTPGWGPVAIQRVQKSVEAGIVPERHAAALRNLATVLLWAGKSEEARRLTDKALELIPEDAATLMLVGRLADADRRFTDALVAYRRVLKSDPTNSVVHYHVASSHFYSNHRDLALAHLFLAARLTPDSAAVQHMLGATYAAMESFREGWLHTVEALRLDPNHGPALRNMGRLKEALGTRLPRPDARPAATFAETHANGSMRLLGEVRKGPAGQPLMHGLRTVWRQDGTPIELATYRDGQPDGTRLEWYPSEALRRRTDYRNSIQDGLEIEWAEDGRVLSEVRFVRGKRSE